MFIFVCKVQSVLTTHKELHLVNKIHSYNALRFMYPVFPVFHAVVTVNIDKEQLAEVPSKTKDANIKIVGGDFIWILTTRS